MSCLYESNALDDAGRCQMFEPDIENAGWSEDGQCVCSEDPVPSFTCEMFECSSCNNEGCEECDDNFVGED